MKNVLILKCPDCESDQLNTHTEDGEWHCATCGKDWWQEELDVTNLEVPK